MIRRPPIATRTDTLFPYTTLFRSDVPWLRGGSLRHGGSRSLRQMARRPALLVPSHRRRSHPTRRPAIAGKSLPNLERPQHIRAPNRSEEHTSELQSLMRISYAVFRWKKKTAIQHTQTITHSN